MVTLIPKGGDEIHVDADVARMSILISDILDDNPEEAIEFNDIEKKHLEKVVEFMTH